MQPMQHYDFGWGFCIGKRRFLFQLDAFECNKALLYQLCDMGFPVDGCKKALYYTRNESIDAEMNWVMEHMNDADFNSPFDAPGAKKGSSNFTADPDAVVNIISMGFTPDQATKALEATNKDMGRAVDWIFSHVEEMETDSKPDESSSAKPEIGMDLKSTS